MSKSTRFSIVRSFPNDQDELVRLASQPRLDGLPVGVRPFADSKPKPERANATHPSQRVRGDA